MAEKAVMAAANHPFVLRLVRTFNHPNYLYMLLELVQGGEHEVLMEDAVTRGRIVAQLAQVFTAAAAGAEDMRRA